jgi:hypothetical protein
MYDLLYLALAVGFFAVTLVLAVLCDRLAESGQPLAQDSGADR